MRLNLHLCIAFQEALFGSTRRYNREKVCMSELSVGLYEGMDVSVSVGVSVSECECESECERECERELVSSSAVSDVRTDLHALRILNAHNLF